MAGGVGHAKAQADHIQKRRLGQGHAPAGLKLDSDEALYAQRQRVVDQAVRLKAMPLGNVTQMTDAERALLARWAAGGFAR